MTEPRPGRADAAGAPDLGARPAPAEDAERVDLSSLIPDNLADLARRESDEIAPPDQAATGVRGVQAADQQPEHVTDRMPDQPAQPARRPEALRAGSHDRLRTGAEQVDRDQETPERATPTVWEQMGGPMGMVDSGLPVVVFVIVNAIAGLGWGIGAALAAGVLIAGMRIARRRPVTQAIAGLFGVGIAAYIAYRTGTAKGYFLLGIWSYLLYGGALLLSMIVRWPLVGVIWEGINGRGAGWRSDRRLVRRYDWATFVWVAVFAARYLVQNYLYDTDQVGWLAAVRLLMGYPLFIAAIAISLVIVAGSAAAREHGGMLKEHIFGLRPGQRAEPRQPGRQDSDPA